MYLTLDLIPELPIKVQEQIQIDGTNSSKKLESESSYIICIQFIDNFLLLKHKILFNLALTPKIQVIHKYLFHAAKFL